MIKIPHALYFVTEIDETHPAGMQLLALSNEMQITLLESMLKELIAPALKEALDHINENGTFAILKVAE
jgi:hypothetical protein